MREVQLEQIEPCLVRHLRSADEIVLHRIHVGAAHLLGDLTVRIIRKGRRRDDWPIAGRQRLIHPLPHALCGSLATRMTELQRHLGVAVRVHEVYDPLPGRDGLEPVHPSATRRNPSLPRNIGHLAEHEAGPTDRSAAEMHEVPFVRHTILGDVLAHRRDDDAITQYHVTQLERRKHGWRCVVRGAWYVGLLLRLVGIPLIDRLDKFGVAHLQVVMRDPETTCQQVERELKRLEVHVPFRILEPLQTYLRGALQALDGGTTFGFVSRQRGWYVTLATQRAY